MAVAPEIFPEVHAQVALETFKDALLGPLGVKTLDASDWNYRGDYDNSNDSSDPKVAHGFNYHQGPVMFMMILFFLHGTYFVLILFQEWLWPLGYYLRARIHFSHDPLKESKEIEQLLGPHLDHLQSSPWFGLPELTNSNGSFCRDSCSIQAWSLSTLLDALYDLENCLKSV